MKPYNPIFEDKQNLTEMALLGTIKQMRIVVWTDHAPPHFHVEKKDSYDARIDIKTLRILDYKWQKNNKTMTSNDFDLLLDWLDQTSRKENNITNKDRVIIVWNALNPDNEL